MKDIRDFWKRILGENAANSCATPKAVFMAGGPGSGKSSVIRKLNLRSTLEVVNPDDAYEAGLRDAGIPLDRESILTQYKPIKDEYLTAVEAGDTETVDRLDPEYQRLRGILSQNMKIFAAARKSAKERQASLAQCRDNFLIDGTGGDLRATMKQIRVLRDSGYDVAMIFVDVPLQTSIERNQARGSRGGRRLADSTVERSWSAVDRNKDAYAEELAENFFLIDASEDNFDDSIAAAMGPVQQFLRRE